MTEHTPGPWVIDPCWDILGNTDDGNGMVCQITTNAVPVGEATANARLIAAAPDLLDALIELKEWIENDCGAECPSDKARDAIAKAGGRS